MDTQKSKLSRFLRGSVIFLLDEITSFLDVESENRIDTLYNTHICIIITPKDIVYHPDNNIVVLENRQIVYNALKQCVKRKENI